MKLYTPHRRSSDFQNISFDWSYVVEIPHIYTLLRDNIHFFDWSVEKFHCQINVVGRYVLISKWQCKHRKRFLLLKCYAGMAGREWACNAIKWSCTITYQSISKMRYKQLKGIHGNKANESRVDLRKTKYIRGIEEIAKNGCESHI